MNSCNVKRITEFQLFLISGAVKGEGKKFGTKKMKPGEIGVVYIGPVPEDKHVVLVLFTFNSATEHLFFHFCEKTKLVSDFRNLVGLDAT